MDVIATTTEVSSRWQGRAHERAAQRQWLALVFALAFSSTVVAQSPESVFTVGGAWSSEGPAAATGGQIEGIAGGPVSGAVEVVVAHPSSADTLWIGAVNGGIFKTINATTASPTWTPQTSSETSLSISALALDPTDGTFLTLVAGVGRQSSFGSIGATRSGLLRTTDGGTTWSSLSSMAGRNISGIAPRGATMVASVNLADSGMFSDLGIFRSTDTGASFTQISGMGGSGLPAGLSYDLASDPTDATRLFAPNTHNGTAADNGIYRSTDTGSTWTKVSSAPMDTLLAASPPPSRVEVAVGNAGGASANVFVAICSGASGSLAGLYYSGDAGITWSALDIPGTTETTGFFGIHPGGQCSIHLSLVPDPTDHDVVFIAGDRQPAGDEGIFAAPFPNAVGATTYSGRLFRVDAGASPGSQATPISHCGPAPPAACGGMRTASASAPHADSREMAFDANGDLIETDDGGIYRHTDPNGTTGDWVSVIGNLAVTEHHDSDWDSNSNMIISGNQDTGTTQQTSVGGMVWSSVSTADGGDVAVATGDPTTTESTRYSSFQFFSAIARRVYNSSGTLMSTTYPTLTPVGGDPAVSAQFTTPIAVNALTKSRLIVGAANGVYESTDRLDTVDQISTDTVNAFGRNAIAYGAGGNADVLYYGSGSTVYVRTAAAPSAPTATTYSGGAVAAIVIDPGDASTAFVVDPSAVHMTSDAGVTSFSSITGNLAGFSPGDLHAAAYVATVGGDGLIVGGDRGIFIAAESDGFAIWDRLGTGLPNVPVYDLHYDPTADALIAGTLGRGAWSLTGIAALVPVELQSWVVE